MQEIQSLSKQASNAHRFGSLYGDDSGTGFAGNVWDSDYLSPTITTMQGGGREPHVMEIKKMDKVNVIGNIYPENPHQSGNVYDTDKLCPTLQSETHSYGIPFIAEKQICAMRGRNPENPSDRTAGIELEQTLEVNKDGVSNCLTSVQKDNLVLETTDVQGLRMVRTEEEKALRKAYESKEIHHTFNEHREPEVKTDGICNTISTVQKDTEVLEMKKIKIRQATKDGFIECELPGIADLELADPDFYNFLYDIDGEIFLIRIRKLTPLECYRLQGVSDEDALKMLEIESNSQCYKAAGNSICVPVLEAIFGQMIPGKEDFYKNK